MSVAIMTASRRSMRPFVIALSTPRHEILAFIDGTRKALGKADGVCRIVKRARRQAASGARAGRWMPNGLCASGANVAYNTSRETVPPCKLIGSGPEPSRCGEDGSHVRSAGRIALLIDGANLFALKALGFDIDYGKLLQAFRRAPICSGPLLFRVGGGTGNGRKEGQPRHEFEQRAHVWADSRPDATARNLSIAPPPTRSKCLAVTGVIRGGLRRKEGSTDLIAKTN